MSRASGLIGVGTPRRANFLAITLLLLFTSGPAWGGTQQPDDARTSSAGAESARVTIGSIKWSGVRGVEEAELADRILSLPADWRFWREDPAFDPESVEEDVDRIREFYRMRGDYTFQGRRFKVRRGVLAFDGSRVANPVVEVEAIYRLRDVDIFAHLSGRLDNIRVRLESDPPMRDSEVLSYLMLGRSSDEALDSRVFNDAASQLALGVAVSEVSPLLETYLPIDTLDLRAGSDDGAPSEVVVGKYLSRSVFVSLGRTLGRDPVDTLRVEWQMMDHWSIETDVSDDENAGGDLIWSFDF